MVSATRFDATPCMTAEHRMLSGFGAWVEPAGRDEQIDGAAASWGWHAQES